MAEEKKENRIYRKRLYIAGLIILLIIIFLAGLIFGSVSLSLEEVFSALAGDRSLRSSVILIDIRLPRVLAGLLAGVGLSVSGVILQGVMNNSLAGPNTIGVGSGAGFFVMLSLIIFPTGVWSRPVFAFAGALVSTLAIFLLAYLADASRMTIILAGITVSSFLSAGINLIKTLNPDMSVNINSFLIGSLSGTGYKNITLPAAGIVIGLILAVFMAGPLNMLGLGEDVAASLGLKVGAVRLVLLVISSILAGCVVSYAGLLSFAGLIVPHICRRLFGNDARILIPCSALLGAGFVMFCDLLGRVMFAPFELPTGIIMSFIGGPFFMYLLLKKKGGRRINA